MISFRQFLEDEGAQLNPHFQAAENDSAAPVVAHDAADSGVIAHAGRFTIERDGSGVVHVVDSEGEKQTSMPHHVWVAIIKYARAQ